VKYMMLIVDEEGFWTNLSEAKQTESVQRVAGWWGDLVQKGKIAAGHQLQPPHTATTVKVRSGRATVSDGPVYLHDGPFNEAKETVGGYGILNVANLDEALAIVKTWPGNNTLELRPVVERG
jgi:hypothetical protein